MSTTSTIETTMPTSPVARRAGVFTALLLAAAALTLNGCLPQQLVIWSPDGAHAVVLDANSSSLCDSGGKLTRLDVGTVMAAAWLPSSKQVLLAVQKSAAKWSDLAAVLDKPTADAAIAAAGDFEKALSATPADKELSDEDGKRIMKDVFEHRGNLIAASVAYLRDNRPDVLRKRLDEGKWKVVATTATTYTQLAVHDLDGESLKPGTVVLNRLKNIVGLRLSPSGKAVAFVIGSDRIENSFALWVVPLAAGARPMEVADQVAVYPDWSADGQSLAYIHATARPQEGSNSPVLLGTLATCRVADASGALLAEPEVAQARAGLLFAETLAVRFLPNGQILFAAAQVTLPATAPDMPQRVTLLAFDPARPATLTRMVPRHAEEELPPQMLFDLSPDGTQVSIAGDDARVCVLTLAGADYQWVQNEKGKLQMLPSWRKAGELCFVIPPVKDSKKPAQVAIWSAGKTQVISADWPENVLENLSFTGSAKSDKPSPASQGNAAPAGGAK